MRLLLLTILWFGLGACSVGPNYEQPVIDTPDNWRIDIAEAEAVANTRWWSQFNDPVLDALVSQALLGNRDVRIAAARIEQFAAQLNITRANYYPQIGYGASTSRQGIQDEAAVPGLSESISDTYQATLNAGWEIDIWGRVRRASEAARADLWGAEEVRRTVLLSLVSSVATSYMSLRRLDLQLEISIDTREARGDALKLFELQFLGGVIGDLQLAQVRSQYEQAAAVVPGIEQEIVQLENLLSELLGRSPGPIPRGRSISDLTLAKVPAGIPSQLLERRPDLRAAEQQLIAANARIGVAKAAYFPSLSLTGLAGFVSGDLSSWFKQDAKVWAVGGDLAGSIFAGGRIKGNVEQAVALRKEALYNYQQVILTALREVEDALVQIQKSTEKLAIEQRQVDALLNYERLAKLRYDNGYTSYIEVLDAQRSLFNAQLNFVNTQNAVFVGLINSYKAMGGGWVDIAQREADRVDFPDATSEIDE
jgi:multidrug efflux system outer membrane protein